MLDWRKGIDFLAHRQHDNAARMLPGRPAYADAPLHNPVNFTDPFMNAALLVIPLDISKRRFIGKRSDSTGPERLSGPENYFGIFMRLALVIAGKIQAAKYVSERNYWVCMKKLSSV